MNKYWKKSIKQPYKNQEARQIETKSSDYRGATEIAAKSVETEKQYCQKPKGNYKMK